MPDFDSPAIRLWTALSRVPDVDTSDPVAGWVIALGLRMQDGEAQYGAVVDRLRFLREQRALVVSQTAELPEMVDPASYLPALERIATALQYQRLRESWQNVRANLTSDVLSTLRLLAQFLPRDPVSISEDELAELDEEITAFRKRVQNGDLSPAAKGFILRQLEILLNAIRTYRYRGPAAFQDASVEASKAWVTRRDDIRGFEQSDEVQEVKHFWEKIVDGGKRAVLVSTFIAALIQTGDAALGVIEKRHLLGPGEQPNAESTLDDPGDPPVDLPYEVIEERDEPRRST